MNITITFGRRGSSATCKAHLTGSHYPRNAARVAACDALAMAQDQLGGRLGDLYVIRAMDQVSGLRWGIPSDHSINYPVDGPPRLIRP